MANARFSFPAINTLVGNVADPVLPQDALTLAYFNAHTGTTTLAADWSLSYSDGGGSPISFGITGNTALSTQNITIVSNAVTAGLITLASALTGVTSGDTIAVFAADGSWRASGQYDSVGPALNGVRFNKSGITQNVAISANLYTCAVNSAAVNIGASGSEVQAFYINTDGTLSASAGTATGIFKRANLGIDIPAETTRVNALINAGAVTSLNALTGGVTLVAGANTTIATDTATKQISIGLTPSGAGIAIPVIRFSPISSGGAGKTFSDPRLQNYPSADYMTVTVNGATLNALEFSFANNTITVITYLQVNAQLQVQPSAVNIAAAALAVPVLDFTGIPAGAANQTFNNAQLLAYNSASRLSVTVNGATLNSSNYSLTGQILTISSYVPPNAAVQVQPTYAGSSAATIGVIDFIGSPAGGINQSFNNDALDYYSSADYISVSVNGAIYNRSNYTLNIGALLITGYVPPNASIQVQPSNAGGIGPQAATPYIAYRLSTPQSISNTMDTMIVFDTLWQSIGSHGINYNAGTFTSITGGAYHISYQTSWDKNTTGSRASFLKISGPALRRGFFDNAANTDFDEVASTCTWFASPGETAQFFVWQNSGTLITFGASSGDLYGSGYAATISFVKFG